MATLIIMNSYFYIIKLSYDFNTILFIKYLVFLVYCSKAMFRKVSSLPDSTYLVHQSLIASSVYCFLSVLETNT